MVICLRWRAWVTCCRIAVCDGGKVNRALPRWTTGGRKAWSGCLIVGAVVAGASVIRMDPYDRRTKPHCLTFQESLGARNYPQGQHTRAQPMRPLGGIPSGNFRRCQVCDRQEHGFLPSRIVEVVAPRRNPGPRIRPPLGAAA